MRKRNKGVKHTLCFPVFALKPHCSIDIERKHQLIIDLLHLFVKSISIFCDLAAGTFLHDLIRSMVNFLYLNSNVISAIIVKPGSNGDELARVGIFYSQSRIFTGDISNCRLTKQRFDECSNCVSQLK